MQSQRQPQMCRKRSAFRQKLRTQYIQNLFRQRRQELYEEEKQQKLQKQTEQTAYKNRNGQHIKQIQEFNIQNKNNQNSHQSHSKYQYDSETRNYRDSQLRDTLKATQFSSYEQFKQYLDKVINLLPETVHLLVNVLNNNPKLVNEFIKYLFSPFQIPSSKKLFVQTSNQPQKRKNLNIFNQKFTQCSVSAFMNYLHILQASLINILQSSQLRIQLIHSTSQRIAQRTFGLLQSSKTMRFQILKGYFDYLVTLGDDIRLLSNMEIYMMSDNIRQIFMKYYSEEEQYRDRDLYDSVILVCNNIVSLPKINKKHGDNKIKQYDDQYETEQLKQLFINQLLKYPKILQNMIILALNPDSHTQLQHILRLLVNLTFVINQPQKMLLFVHPLSIMIITILGSSKFYERLSIINVLLLRLINNVVINDQYCGQILWDNLIISKTIQNYGYWLLQGHQLQEQIKNISTTQPEGHVLAQFLSTITTYITMLSDTAKQQRTQQYIRLSQHNYIGNLQQLIYNKHIYIILLQSLTKSVIVQSEQQTISKCLQSILILSNYQSNIFNQQFNRKPVVNRKLVQYKQLFENIIQNIQNHNIHAFCNSLMHIIGQEEDKIMEEDKLREEEKKNFSMYEECLKEYNIRDENKPSNQ